VAFFILYALRFESQKIVLCYYIYCTIKDKNVYNKMRILGSKGSDYSAAYFDGVNDYINISSSGDWYNVNSFTMEFWAKPTHTRNVTSESSTGISGTNAQRYAISASWGGLASLNRAGVGVSVGTNGISVFYHADNYMPSPIVHQMTISDWTHIAVTGYKIDATNYQTFLYVNGAYIKGSILTERTLYPSGFRFGGEGYGWYGGGLDEIRIWSVVRTQQQINDNMLRGYSVPPSELIAYYKLDGNAKDYLKTYDGTEMNGVTWGEGKISDHIKILVNSSGKAFRTS
jgi:hypothetical protein